MKAATRFACRVALLALLAGCSTLLVDSYDYGRIDVQARLASGDPADGIPVILYRNREHLAYGLTDSQGEITFDFVPYGVVGVYLNLSPTYLTADSLPSAYLDGLDVGDGGSETISFTNLIRVGEAQPDPTTPVP